MIGDRHCVRVRDETMNRKLLVQFLFRISAFQFFFFVFCAWQRNNDVAPCPTQFTSTKWMRMSYCFVLCTLFVARQNDKMTLAIAQTVPYFAEAKIELATGMVHLENSTRRNMCTLQHRCTASLQSGLVGKLSIANCRPVVCLCRAKIVANAMK